MPRRIGRFEILEELGRGTGGIVYRARDPHRSEPVALKLSPREPGQREPPREVRALTRLQHPGILPLLEVEPVPDGLLLVTELMEGSSLAATLELPLPEERLWPILGELSSALEYLHSRGVIHGDLKPSNILRDFQGRLRLADFGLARLGTEGLDDRGFFRGSPLYAAPEVCRGEPPDRRSDLYSLGVMIYEWLTGRPPLQGDTVAQTLRRTIRDRPRSPGLLRADLDPRLERAVLRLLEKEPGRRFQTAALLWRFLHPLIPEELRGAFVPAVEGEALVGRPVLCGREEELAQLLAVVDRGGLEGRAVLLTGPAGIGRTRLLEEVRFRRSLDGTTFLRPDVSQGASPMDLLKELEQRISTAREDRVVVLWDDLQGGDQRLRERLAELLFQGPERGTWLLAVRREEPSDPWARLVEELRRRAPERLLELALLPAPAISSLAGSALGTQGLPEPWLERLVQTAEGSPLLALEILRDDLAGGTLRWEEEGWSFRQDRRGPLDPTALEQGGREVLQLLALAEVPLPETALRSMLGTEDPTEPLSRLVGRGTLQESKAGLMFRLPGYREAISRGIPPERCRELHRFLGDYWEAHPEREDLAVLARRLRHRRGAGQDAEALPGLIQLGSALKDRGRPREALEALQEALELARQGGDASQRLRLLSEVGRLARVTGERSLEEEISRELLTQARGAGDPLWQGRAALASGKVAHSAGDLARGEGEFRRAVELLVASETKVEGLEARMGLLLVLQARGAYRSFLVESERTLVAVLKLGDRQAELRARYFLGTAANEVGDYRRATRELEGAIRLGEELESLGPQATCWGELGRTHLSAGRTKRARDCFRTSRELFLRLEHPRGAGLALSNIGLTLLEQGEPRRALEVLEEAEELTRQHGPAQALARALSHRARTEHVLGRPEEARRYREAALEAAEPIQDRALAGSVLLEGGRAAWDQGEPDQAERLVEEALELADGLEQGLLLCEGCLLRGQLAAERWDPVAAGHWLERAGVLARDMGARGMEVEAALELALLDWDNQGEGERILEDLQRVVRISTAGGAAPIELRAWIGILEIAHLMPRPRMVQQAREGLVRCLRSMDDRAAGRHLFFRALPSGLPLGDEVRELAGLIVEGARQTEPRIRFYARLILTEEEPDPVLAASLGLARGLHVREKRRQGTPERSRATGTKPGEERRMNQPIRVLLASTRSLLQSLDADSLLRSVMDQILEVTGASRGFLMLRRDDGELLFRVSRDFRQEEIAEPRFSTSRSIIQQVVETGETFLSGDLAGDRSLGQRESIQRLALASVLCVPIPGVGGEEPGEGWPVEGVIYVDNPAELELFHEPAKRLLVEALAALTSLALANLRSAADLEQDNRRLRRELSGRYRLGRLLGRSPVMQELFTRMERILPFHEPVLIVGETGTGKELAARALHFEGPRRQGPFESVNCATLSGSLLEAELFGVSRGAATGVAARARVIERAHGGTLFLDEVGELSPDVQVKLLRVLELRELTRVGGVRGIPVDIRILSATNRDLEGEVTDGRFRKDLYFRLKGLTLRLPSLTERQEDIPLLAEHFLAEFLEEESQLKLKGFTPQALRELVRHPWEGNVRELRSQVRTAAINEEASRIGVAALAFDRSEAPASNIPCQPQGSLRACLERLERELILRALEECSGVKKEAARRLELSPRALSHYLRKHGIR